MAEKPPAAEVRNDIESVLHEDRKFECPEDFRQQAHIRSLDAYERIYRESVEQPEKFWGGIASELHWFKKWDKVLEWKASVGQMVRWWGSLISPTTALTVTYSLRAKK